MKSSGRKLAATGLITFSFIASVKYIAQTPYRFAAVALGFLPLL